MSMRMYRAARLRDVGGNWGVVRRDGFFLCKYATHRHSLHAGAKNVLICLFLWTCRLMRISLTGKSKDMPWLHDRTIRDCLMALIAK